ncbi:MAG: WD40/YVTN/BNR-like repeat-containing protein, partial [Candidatus Angelobacter sp.]
GDYKEPKKGKNVAAVTHDGGKTWTLASKQPHGYRSAVAVGASHILVAVGTSGADVSHDGGNTWTPMFTEELNALALVGNLGWAVGPGGKIVTVHLNSH